MPCASAHTAPTYSTAARSTLRRLSSAKKDVLIVQAPYDPIMSEAGGNVD